MVHVLKLDYVVVNMDGVVEPVIIVMMVVKVNLVSVIRRQSPQRLQPKLPLKRQRPPRLKPKQQLKFQPQQ